MRVNPSLVAESAAAYEVNGDRVFGSVVLMSYSGLEVLDKSLASLSPVVPYLPGYLAIREGPVLVNALEGLKNRK